ncbi:MAG: protein translocase subunit SecDF [Chitinophagales bacterium]
MQAKGFIKILIIGLLIAALYQLSFTVLASRQQDKAEKYAMEIADEGGKEGDEYQIEVTKNKKFYLDSIKNEVVYNFGIADFTYKELTERQLSLGLDLKGGISMLVEVDQADALRQISLNHPDKGFNDAIDAAIADQANSTDGFIDLFGKKYEELNPNGNLASIFANIEEFRDRVDNNSSNADVLKEIKKDVKAKTSETHNVLTTRIDQFGVAQPNITEPDDNGRINIELPGADNADRIREIIQTSAILEFYETSPGSQSGNILFEMNDVLIGVLGLEVDTAVVEIVEEEVVEEAIDTAVATLDDGLGDLGNDLSGLETDLGEDTTANNEALFPLFQVLSPQLSVDEASGQQYWSESPIIASTSERYLEQAKDYLALEELQAVIPRDVMFLWSAKPYKNQETGEQTDVYFLYAIKKSQNGGPALTGETIRDAYPSVDELGRPAVSMSMNTTGATKWEKVTGENVGVPVAIVLDNKVFSAPAPSEAISGGNSQISGLDDFEESEDLANILKSGKLEAQINILEGVEIGASMGGDSKRAGLAALAIGLILVLLFMILYYSGAGAIANIALVANLILIVGFLAGYGAALTLPGMAGIVLTIGMAVDANVIIFERIREELRRGKGLRLAISDGFSRSYAAIIDANATTLIAAVVLYKLGSGPVTGFAIVLIVGIIASLISAVFLTRLIFEGFIARDKKVGFSMGWSEKVFANTNINFLGKRKIAYIISSVIIVAGLVSMFTKGFDLGVDFKGGRSYVVAFDQEVDTDGLREALTVAFDDKVPVVKQYGVSSKVQVTTSYMIGENATNVDSIIVDKLYAVAQDFYNEAPSQEVFTTVSIESVNKVDTSIADDIKSSAYKAGSVGAFLIFLYLLFRFRKWQFGVGALGAVVHDILIILSIFSIFSGILPFSLEIEQKFIAALLTIIGYSINDTVVVFDRIREYLTEHPKRALEENVNGAINSTLSRTLMTSLTTFLVVVVLFIVGGEAIRGFSFALLVGVLVGTYSSIFIASSILVDTMKGKKGKS